MSCPHSGAVATVPRRVPRRAPRRALLTLALIVTAGVTSGGCFLLAAGAGAGAAVAYTNRGASGQVEGTVDAAFARAVAAFGTLDIKETGRSTENSGDTRRLIGTVGETEVTVELTRAGSTTTKADVVARRNVVEFDRELAKRVLEAVVSGR
jgi:hypothetical protein